VKGVCAMGKIPRRGLADTAALVVSLAPRINRPDWRKFRRFMVGID